MRKIMFALFLLLINLSTLNIQKEVRAWSEGAVWILKEQPDQDLHCHTITNLHSVKTQIKFEPDFYSTLILISALH